MQVEIQGVVGSETEYELQIHKYQGTFCTVWGGGGSHVNMFWIYQKYR